MEHKMTGDCLVGSCDICNPPKPPINPCRAALAELVRLEGELARGPDNVGELRELQRQHKEAMAAARAALAGAEQ